MAQLFKLMHMLSILSALGLLIFAYVHFFRSVLRRFFDPALLSHFHRSFDTALGVCWCLSLLFGLLLVHPKGYTMTTPWIHAAIIFMSVLFLLWLASLVCKYRLLRSLTANQAKGLCDWVAYHVLHGLMFVIVVAVARDAVMKTTWLVFS